MTRILAPLFCGLVLFVRPVHATTHVYPGPGTPLQDAIDAAADGAILVVHHGAYEAVTVTKRLRLIHPKNEDPFFQPTVIFTCAAPTALTIAADGVRVYGIQVWGGTVSSVDIQNRDDVRLDRVSMTNDCGTAQHAVNVYASTRVKLFRIVANIGPNDDPYEDAVFYLRAIPAGGKIRLKQSGATFTSRGVTIEDSGPGSVTVQGSTIAAVTMGGILLRNSDGILLKGNTVRTAGGIGIELDATSDGNRIDRNEIISGGIDVVDSGTGNCWLRNIYSTGTVPPCP